MVGAAAVAAEEEEEGAVPAVGVGPGAPEEAVAVAGPGARRCVAW